MGISVFLEFNGNASEAIDFYKGIFGGEVYKMTYGDMPSQGDFELPSDQKALVAYASIDVKGTKISLSDVLPAFGGPEVTVGNNVTAMYSTDDFDEGKKIYDASFFVRVKCFIYLKGILVNLYLLYLSSD